MKSAIIFLAVFLLFTSFAFAEGTENLQLSRGWNLVSVELVGSQAMENTFFFFDPINKNFVGTGASKLQEDTFQNAVKQNYGRSGEDYFELASMWVFLDQPMTVSVTDRSSSLSYLDYTLFEGWNLISIQSSLIGAKLSNVGRDCDIKRAYYFDSVSQSWQDIGLNESLDFPLGSGIVVKTGKTCKPDFEAGDMVQQPPTLPN